MQRLIMEINSHGTETAPIVYSSKEEFLECLKNEMLKRCELLLSFQKELYRLNILIFEAKDKDSAESKRQQHLDSRPSTDIEVGGIIFDARSFIRVEGEDFYVDLPDVYTLDEYFAEVEKKLDD